MVYSEYKVKVGSALRALRKGQGLSQAAAARRLGVTPRQISRWERGELRSLEIGRFFQLLDAYGADISDLLRILDPKEQERKLDDLFASVEATLRSISHPPFPQPETGSRFLELRERSGWSLEEVAERVSLPLALLEAFERGEEVELGGAELRSLAKACCGDLAEILPQAEKRVRWYASGAAVDSHG